MLMEWACNCSEHVLHLFGNSTDPRLLNALHVAKKWKDGYASVGEARKASLDAIAVANESSNPVSIAVARSVGHAVATAHMSDHSMGAGLYALIAVKNAGKSIEEEKEWQNQQLASELKNLVIPEMRMKEQMFKILRR